MKQWIDPKTFGLPATTRILKTGADVYRIVVKRKSRIVMKDGQKLLEKAEKIKAHLPRARIGLETTAPVCSKTKQFLESRGIDIHTE